MPQVLWMCYFLEAQGFKVTDSTVYQDNQSAILLEKNGRGSSSKRTHHISIRYFFVTDWIGSGEISIHYCPTADMISDFFTKPLQGATFCNLCAQIMNIDPDTYQLPDHRSVLEEEDHGTRNPECAAHITWAKVVKSGRNNNGWFNRLILFRFSGYKSIWASTVMV